MISLSLALKSFVFRRREYISLFLVCVFGVGFSLFALSVSRGMISSLSDKARIYYGGDYVVMGGTNTPSIENAYDMLESVEKSFESSDIDANVSVRFDFDAKNSAYFFEGAEARQRVIKGVDFSKETALFKKINFVSGGVPSDEPTDCGRVLLSAPVANTLGCDTGDEITLLLLDKSGYLNTARLKVAGIYKDSSVFGMYTSYADISVLRSTFGESETWANRICIDTNAAKTKESDARFFQNALEKNGFNMFPLVSDKRVFYEKLGQTFQQITFALIPLSANLSDIEVMEIALKIISLFVISMLVIIIVCGIGSTWRVVVIKRLGEIGIYRACGMKKRTLFLTLVWEAAALIFAGCSGGVFFALFFQKLISIFNFSFIPSFDIFLTNGAIIPQTDFAGGAVVLTLVAVSIIFVVFHSVKKAVSVMPSDALAACENL